MLQILKRLESQLKSFRKSSIVMNCAWLFALIAIVYSSTSCSRKETNELGPGAEELLFHDVPQCESVSNILRRANIMVNLHWIPLNPVPNMLGSYYPAGQVVLGVPYSSGQEMCTFVGQDVSFYTFLSAVNNPYSYLYTQDLSVPPYKGDLCRTYYGTVCSAAVDYALGLRFQYTTYMYKQLPFFSVVSKVFDDDISLCDLLLEEGHVGMIYDIIRDRNGRISNVSVFESVHEGTKITEYSRSQFISKWNRVKWELLRYSKIKQTTADGSNDSFALGQTFEFNPCLSTAKGDRVTYAERDSILVNIFKETQGELVVMKDHLLFSSVQISGNSVVLSGLPCGDYEVYILKKDSTRSPSIYFDVVNTYADVAVDEKVTVRFNNATSTPICLVFCQLSHRYLAFHEISEDDMARGYITVNPEEREAYYYKVLFQGKYGRVASDLRRVR